MKFIRRENLVFEFFS